MTRRVGILGNGGMGIACAMVLCQQPETQVAVWGHDREHLETVAKTRRNDRLLPEIDIPVAIRFSAHIEEVLEGIDDLIVAIPSAFLRETLTRLQSPLPRDIPYVSVIKGIENSSLLRPSQIIQEILGPVQVVVLSGPSHAEEICRQLPASVVAAHPQVELAKRIQQLFTTDRFRVYTNADLVGVELCGALKNVIAIAAGICDGLGYGDNAKAALVARGLSEMIRFGMAFGAIPDTFSGLAGLGDLVTTCISQHGRNRLVGMRLGKGDKLSDILASMASVAEGVLTSRSLHQMAEARGIDMPITREVYRILFEDKLPTAATAALMMRPVGEETR